MEVYSFQNEEGILLNLLVFCFRYGSVCPSVYTVMTLAISCCAANRFVLKLKDGKLGYYRNLGSLRYGTSTAS